ncbi:PREDICTED: leukocyte immunoglobulin-like receptor subfamily B member 5, partial [Myotis davidii]|uniref:leukocyte immunoglobulin-like receptor subfamily B member 5 n=1 Tax=Myotis davidii TaxID=225400 RepID=UPI000766E8F5
AIPKPTIRAEPGPMIPLGSSVTIWCQGTPKVEVYRLYKEGNAASWYQQKTLDPGDRAKFSITHMTKPDAGRYRCSFRSPSGWSGRSDPLELVVTGSSRKPNLSALPSPVVTTGGKVTLQCGSWEGFDRFILTKEGDHKLSWTLDSQPQPSGWSQALFPVGPVTRTQRWRFRCYGCYRNRLNLCSLPSDALELLVPGLSEKPSLLSPQGPIVVSGQSLTLQCRSDVGYDRFALHKEEGCYGGYNLSSEWSAPSDPLDILVAGPLNILIGVSVALVLLLSILLFLLLRNRCQNKDRTSHLQVFPNPNHVSSPFLPLLQAAVRDTPQYVTYAQLNLLTLNQKTTAPHFSPSDEPPDEHIVYASLSVH